MSGKKKLKKKRVRVPHPSNMPDEDFIRHLEKRHAKECKIEGFIHRNNIPIWLPMYRTFHDRLHRLEIPGQYNHHHEEK